MLIKMLKDNKKIKNGHGFDSNPRKRNDLKSRQLGFNQLCPLRQDFAPFR